MGIFWGFFGDFLSPGFFGDGDFPGMGFFSWDGILLLERSKKETGILVFFH